MATHEGFSIPLFPSKSYFITWVATLFMELTKKLIRKKFTCSMCKSNIWFDSQYVLETFEILPKTPKEELIVCYKCAIRESKFKKRKDLDSYLDEL